MSMVVQIGSDVKGALRGIEEVSLSLKEQKAVLQNLKREYAALSTQQARGSAGKLIAADIKVANSEIQRLKAGAVPAFGAIGGAATKAFSGLRSLAYVLPGLGIAGIFNLAFEGLEKLMSGMSSGVSAIQKFNDAISQTKKETVGVIANVFELKNEIQLAKDGFISKEGVVKHYNETIGKTTGIVKSLDEAEAALNKNAAAYVKFTLFKAVATMAFQKASESLFEAIKDLLRKPTEDESAMLKVYPWMAPIFQKKALEKQKKNLNEFFDFTKLGIKTDKMAAELAKAFGFDFFGGNKTPKPPKFDIKDFLAAFPKQRVRIAISDAEIDLDRVKDVLIQKDKIKTFKELVEEKISKQLEDLVIAPHLKMSIVTDEATINAAKAAAKLAEDFNKAFENAFAEGAASLGEILGNAFSGVDTNIGETMGQLFGGLLDTIGKALISYGIVKAGLDKILSSGGIVIPGAVAIALGIAAVAAGQLARNVSHRAAGGPVGSGMPILVGERGPELLVPSTSGRIVPNNNLSGLQGSATQAIVFNGRLAVSGNELKLLLNRTDRYQAGNV